MNDSIWIMKQWLDKQLEIKDEEIKRLTDKNEQLEAICIKVLRRTSIGDQYFKLDRASEIRAALVELEDYFRMT